MSEHELDVMMDAAEVQRLFETAMKYIYADGVEENYAKAAELLEQAAEQGHREAAYQLGICYHNGYGVEQDLRTAYQLYLRSALQGYGKGYTLVGDFYAEGICVRQNYREAIKWYLDATVSEDLTAAGYAEYKLAGFLANGCGVETDVEQAVQWYEKALAHGEQRAKPELERLGYYASFRIRPAAQRDAEAIDRLNRQEWNKSAETLTEKLKVLLEQESQRIWVAVADGNVVGYIHCCTHDTLWGAPMKLIAGMALSSSCRDMGVEEALLDTARQWAGKSGCELRFCRSIAVDQWRFDGEFLFG